jgi:outer membrane protein TolC
MPVRCRIRGSTLTQNRVKEVFSTVLLLALFGVGEVTASTPQATPRPPTPVLRASPVNPSQKQKSSGRTVYYTLQKYIRAVVGQDAGLISARLEQMSNAEQVKSVRAQYLPHLNAVVDVGLVAGPQFLPLVGQTSHVAKLRTVNAGVYEVGGAALTMPIFKDGTFLGINTPPAANIKKAQGEILVAQSKLDALAVAYRATEVFLRAISSGNQVEILRQQFELVQKQTEIVEERARYNLVTAEDLAAAENKLKDSRLRFETGIDAAVDSFFRVAELVGIEDPRQVRIDTKYPNPAPLPKFDSMMLRINQGHPAIAAQEAAINEAKANLALKHAQLWPSSTVRATYRYGEDLSQIGQDQFVGILAFSAPIFDFGELHYAAKAADLSLQSQNEKLVKVHVDLRQSIFTDFTKIQSTTELVAYNSTTVIDEQRTVDRLLELAKYGQVAIPALLQAQVDLLDSKQIQQALTLQLFLDYAFLEQTTAGEWKWLR